MAAFRITVWPMVALFCCGGQQPRQPSNPTKPPPTDSTTPGRASKKQAWDDLVLPYISQGACPFECCQYGHWKTREGVVLRAAPDASALVSLELEPGLAVRALTGHVRVSQTTRVRLRRRTRASLIDGQGQRDIGSGQILHLLYPVGEGFVHAFHAGVFLELEGARFHKEDKCLVEDCPGIVLQQGSHEWWIHILHGDAQGWTNEAEKFDGTDACD
jgi:hypothetical protein